MIKESEPRSPQAHQFPPSDGRAYKVQTGDSWGSIASAVGLDAWTLIEFNFPYLATVTPFDEKCRQVNWLMRIHVGCSRSNDQKNYAFDAADSPGWIYLPSSDGKVGFPEPIHLIALLTERRRQAFKRALELFDEGAHFILGARAKVLDAAHVFGAGHAVWLESPDTHASHPRILAAGSLDGSKDRNICVGRFAHPDVKAAGGGKISASDPALKMYLDGLRALKTPHASWPSIKKGTIELTPRTFFEGGRDVIVLGEKCLGKRHVDCVSLVNHCTGFSFSIPQYMKGLAGPVVMNKDKGDFSGPKVKDGDIVIKHANHIGICGVDEATGVVTVIEATGAREAIIKTTFANTRQLDRASKWRFRVRPLL